MCFFSCPNAMPANSTTAAAIAALKEVTRLLIAPYLRDVALALCHRAAELRERKVASVPVFGSAVLPLYFQIKPRRDRTRSFLVAQVRRSELKPSTANKWR
jgi:hypothetical protein